MEGAKEKKLPKSGTFKRWKLDHSWLEYGEGMKMVCKICTAQKSKIEMMQSYNSTFINGSTNYKPSTLKDHAQTDCHKRAVRENDEMQAKASGISLPIRTVVQKIPEDSAIKKCVKKMTINEHKALVKLFHIAYFIAQKGHAFTDFKDMVELEKLHEVEFQYGAYENETACRTFVNSIAEYLFNKDVGESLKKVNFLAVLCDGSTDISVTEQEVVYVSYRDPVTLLPTLKIFNVVAPKDSQDAPGLKEAIKDSFKKHDLESVLSKMAFLSSDGASVNSGKNSGLIRLFQEDYEWLCFIWCFSHRLELALKDALKDFIDPVDESLRHLYYLYQKSSKKNRELKNMYELLKDQYEMYGSGVKPVKATGTRWIDHRLRAMQKLVDKYGLYTSHLQNVIADTTKQTDRALLQGKFTKLVDARVLLRGAFFLDALAEAKKFSLLTQKRDISIIDVVESVETTKRSYERLLKRFRKNENYVFELLPTLKAVVNTIEDNEDGEPIYQGQKVKRYLQEKQHIQNHAVEIVERILSCFDQRFGNMYTEDAQPFNVVADDGDNIIFDVCLILNTSVWPKLDDGNEDDEMVLGKQLDAVKRIYQRYCRMDAFTSVTQDETMDGYIDIVRYANRYFNTDNVNPMDVWAKLAKIGCTKTNWNGAMLVSELCLCAPFSNATLERFFSHMNIVKTDVRSRLSSKSLNSTLRIRMTNLPLAEFDSRYVNECVDYWYDDKERRINQGQRKSYKERESNTAKRIKFNIQDMPSSSSSEESESDS